MEGYSKLANLMGDDRTDGHYLIFQKFESVSAQNLLYLQAEIINLKENFDKIAEINSKSEDPQKQKFTQDWEVLSSSEDSVQWEKWLEIRCKLKEYCKIIHPTNINKFLTGIDKAIAHHRMITGLPAPTSYDLNFIQQWLERPRLGNCAFTGADCDVYDPHNCNGLITLALGGGQMDAMTRLLVNVLPNIYHWGFVHPIYRICGRWIKVNIQSGTNAYLHRILTTAETRVSPNRDTLGKFELGRRVQNQNLLKSSSNNRNLLHSTDTPPEHLTLINNRVFDTL
jgi:hypothetical protein